MTVSSALLLNFSMFVLLHIILLISLSCCAKKNNIALSALLNKYKKARGLFELTFILQVIIFVIALVTTMTVAVNSPDETVNPAKLLFMLGKLIYLMEAIFVVPLMVDDTTDTIRYINKDLSKQSLKKSIKF